MQHILIAGASGFVGKYLSAQFLSQGVSVTGLGTSPHHSFEPLFENFTWVRADTASPGAWQEHVARADIVINLAGRNIFKPWTRKYKQAIYDSRILTTQHLVEAMGQGKPAKLLNASAVGYYGDGHETVLIETAPPGTDFLAKVSQDWEAQALAAAQKQVKVCILRFGIVLGKAGALSAMVPAFKFFVGGPLGSGNQWFPWIHIHDLYRGVKFLMDDPDLEGIYNFTGPGLVRQKEFAQTLGRVLGRPAFMPAPAFMVKLVMGELGSSLLQGQKARSTKLEALEFEFEFEDSGAALEDIFKKQ